MMSVDLIARLISLRLSGLRYLHLRLLCAGDGGEDSGSGDLWPALLFRRHLEQTGLLHRDGGVRTRNTTSSLLLNLH